jgi:hypothetical protein
MGGYKTRPTLAYRAYPDYAAVELPESCAALQAFLMETSSLQCRNAGRLLLGRNRLENNLGDGFGL